MFAVVPIIVIAIIALQIVFFVKNIRRMKEYAGIFVMESSWGIIKDSKTGFVTGMLGDGDEVFLSIKDSINKYLSNSAGSVIDYQLLKDAADRHCDSLENDVNTLMPVPLYCGLAGTMAGVIVGLYSLLSTGSITALLSSGSGDFSLAADGVNDLLWGVAWAMVASICGIFLTTFSSILFKRYKLEGEFGKNTFLAWLQGSLLPELPSDTSDALNKLVNNLNKFNATFAENTTSLRGALKEVNESYRIQADIIRAVHNMDVMKMAKANVNVLRELKECTDKLELFNQYLNDIHGYTDVIHTFTSQFEHEANRLHVLEEIQQYFMRHKAEIAKDAADVDSALRNALGSLKETAGENVGELHKVLVRQAEEFKQILLDEKESFEKINGDIKAQFCDQLAQMPMLERKLSEISAIPTKLDTLIRKIEQANANLSTSVSTTMQQTAADILSAARTGSDGTVYVGMPKWMRWTVVVSVVAIAIACLANTANNMFFREYPAENIEDTMGTIDSLSVGNESTAVMTNEADSIK